MKKRLFSGMRPTGKLHLGNYFGALKNWVELQDSGEYETYFSIVDWHALTTNYENPEDIYSNAREVLLDWLAVGIDINKSEIIIQSSILETAELNLILGMLTPVSWLERSPSYKEMKANIKDKDLSGYGFLGYPVLQTADILVLKGTDVPVGLDQEPHIEMSREIVRRFNNMYNTDIFPEPRTILSPSPKLLGTDGRKMSKSYGNVIMLDHDLKEVETTIKRMLTDENRKLRTDKGNPEVCPVFDYHKLFSTEDEKAYCIDGCTNAKIGCIDCKKLLCTHVVEFLEVVQEKRVKFDSEIKDIKEFLEPSINRVRAEAQSTMEDVRSAIKI